ncbi:MAG: MmcQ/YjbR family DNA-binding protein [Steroidobacteraceae bacterium]
MTPEMFRELAVQLPGVIEGEHHAHAYFRVGRKIFATLGYPTVEFATILLTPQEQASFVQAEPASFAPVPGGWGRKGSTHVRLKSSDLLAVSQALRAAWKRRAPKRLAAQFVE